MTSPIPTDSGIDNLAQIAIDGARALLNESKPNLKDMTEQVARDLPGYSRMQMQFR